MFWKNFVHYQEKSVEWCEYKSDCDWSRVLSDSDIWWQSDTIVIAKKTCNVSWALLKLIIQVI